MKNVYYIKGNEMKSRKYYIVGTVPKSNRKNRRKMQHTNTWVNTTPMNTINTWNGTVIYRKSNETGYFMKGKRGGGNISDISDQK